MTIIIIIGYDVGKFNLKANAESIIKEQILTAESVLETRYVEAYFLWTASFSRSFTEAV